MQQPRSALTALIAALTLLSAAPALAQTPSTPPPKPAAVEADKGEQLWEIKGLYTVWGLAQHHFLLGADNPLDSGEYVVQLLRVNARLGWEHAGVVARLDAAQGWWGVDNSPDVATGVATGQDGAVTGNTQYNPYKLFRFKDTNYDVHFDHAFLYVDVPHTPIRVQIGRQPFAVGQKLVLDEDYDGLIVNARPLDALQIEGLWAHISEGRGSVQSPTGALINDDDERADANLLGGRAILKTERLLLEGFGLYYKDQSNQEDYAYLPQGLGYLQPRLRPQITDALAFGVAADARLDLLDGLRLEAEVDYLMGHDGVENADHAGAALDLNDGDLRGWNALARITQEVKLGVPLTFTLTAGIGSGDPDPTGGAGNINKIETMGSFFLTEVWEDSVMPDIGGISPQGLGSPVSRGYRELENTTAAQLKLGAQLLQPLRLEVAWTFLRATEPVRGFDATGAPTHAAAKELGQEVDAWLTLVVYPGVTAKVAFGYFVPGEAAALLIHGASDPRDAAWELKPTLDVAF